MYDHQSKDCSIRPETQKKKPKDMKFMFIFVNIIIVFIIRNDTAIIAHGIIIKISQ